MAKATHSTGGRVGLEIQDIHLFAQALFTYIYMGGKKCFPCLISPPILTHPSQMLYNLLQHPPAKILLFFSAWSFHKVGDGLSV